MNGPILIIGAGISGFLLAQGLRSRGITYRLFERDGGAKPSRDWGMSMHWGADFLSSILPTNKIGRLHEINTDPFYDSSKDAGYVQCNGETGEILVIMKAATPRRISRAKFKRLLSEGVDIEHDKKLVAVSTNLAHTTVTASFSDGTTAHGSLLIGCDGSRSQVREIMIGDADLTRPRTADCTIMNFACTFPSAISKTLREIHPIFKGRQDVSPRCRAWDIPGSKIVLTNISFLVLDSSSPGAGDWVHQILLSWSGTQYPEDLEKPESHILRLKDLGGPFASPWRVAASNVSNDSIINVDRGTFWDPRSVFTATETLETDEAQSRVRSLWNGNDHHGLMTLAGDAAHPMLPHRGQGLNHSIEDVSRLLAALEKVLDQPTSDLSFTIAQYEQEMITRTGTEVEPTLKQARVAHDWQLLMRAPMFQLGANKVNPV